MDEVSLNVDLSVAKAPKSAIQPIKTKPFPTIPAAAHPVPRRSIPERHDLRIRTRAHNPRNRPIICEMIGMKAVSPQTVEATAILSVGAGPACDNGGGVSTHSGSAPAGRAKGTGSGGGASNVLDGASNIIGHWFGVRSARDAAARHTFNVRFVSSRWRITS